MSFLERLGIDLPIIQAPMAGVSTPSMAATISNGGGLGSIAVGAGDAAAARAMIEQVRVQTARAFNVNLFVHAPPRIDPDVDRAWLDAMSPLFAAFGTVPPGELRTIYTGFTGDDAMLDVLVEQAPAVVSFHFGLPHTDQIAALKAAGCLLIATATRLSEAQAIEASGIDAVVAQGYEAGGHRGMFDPDAPDEQLDTLSLTGLLVAESRLPVIAAGGIMDGRGVREALDLGAAAVQLGTAFIACPESAADTAYRAALNSDAAFRTQMTRAVSGRPARCLANRFTAWGETADLPVPDYPRAYDAGKALNAAAKARGEGGYGAQWAGTGAPFARDVPAAELLATLSREAGLTPSSPATERG